MAEYKILVKYKNGIFDADAERIKKDIFSLGIKKNVSVKIAHLYEISSEIGFDKIKNICNNLLVDFLIQQLFINFDLSENNSAVEVYYKIGVTDTVAETVSIGINDIGIKRTFSIRTGKKYYLGNNLSRQEIKKIAEKILCNTVVQKYEIIDGN
mgnify:CR=1 FL=1